MIVVVIAVRYPIAMTWLTAYRHRTIEESFKKKNQLERLDYNRKPTSIPCKVVFIVPLYNSWVRLGNESETSFLEFSMTGYTHKWLELRHTTKIPRLTANSRFGTVDGTSKEEAQCCTETVYLQQKSVSIKSAIYNIAVHLSDERTSSNHKGTGIQRHNSEPLNAPSILFSRAFKSPNALQRPFHSQSPTWLARGPIAGDWLTE